MRTERELKRDRNWEDEKGTIRQGELVLGKLARTEGDEDKTGTEKTGRERAEDIEKTTGIGRTGWCI